MNWPTGFTYVGNLRWSRLLRAQADLAGRRLSGRVSLHSRRLPFIWAAALFSGRPRHGIQPVRLLPFAVAMRILPYCVLPCG